jgi:hypothetical protein
MSRVLNYIIYRSNLDAPSLLIFNEPKLSLILAQNAILNLKHEGKRLYDV